MSPACDGWSRPCSRPLELVSSPATRVVRLAALAVGLALVATAPLHPVLEAALLGWLALAAALARTREGARARWSPRRGWQLAVRGDPGWTPARPGHATRVFPALVLLWLIDARGRRRCLVLTPGPCGTDTHRRLRARLRLGAPAPAPPVAGEWRG